MNHKICHLEELLTLNQMIHCYTNKCRSNHQIRCYGLQHC